MRLWLRGARPAAGGEPVDLLLERGRVAAVEPAGSRAGDGPAIDLAGQSLLPGLVNGHDVLDLAPFPPLGRPPFRSLYEWTASLEDGVAEVRALLAIPLPDRLFLGGLRNLLAGATAVVHHGPHHRALAHPDFPVRVQGRYGFAPSPGQSPRLRRTYRTTDRRIPWFVRAAEGTDERSRGEVDVLAAAGVLRQNTVILHGTGLRPEDLPRLAAARACVVWCPETDRRLYASSAPVRQLLAAGVRVGLGSDSAAAGSRDALSNLAAANGEGVLARDELLSLATQAGGEVARLPVGAFAPGAPADFLVARSSTDLVTGAREALELVVVRGHPLYGNPEYMTAAGIKSQPLRIEGAVRALETNLCRRLRAILRDHPRAAEASWLATLDFPGPESRADAV